MKKTLITIALAVAGVANAGTLVQMPNKSGGMIQLTDGTSERCKDLSTSTSFKWNYVISSNQEGGTVRGCWRFIEEDDQIEIRWGADGDYKVSLFSNKDFTRTQYLNELLRKDKERPVSQRRFEHNL